MFNGRSEIDLVKGRRREKNKQTKMNLLCLTQLPPMSLRFDEEAQYLSLEVSAPSGKALTLCRRTTEEPALLKPIRLHFKLWSLLSSTVPVYQDPRDPSSKHRALMCHLSVYNFRHTTSVLDTTLPIFGQSAYGSVLFSLPLP